MGITITVIVAYVVTLAIFLVKEMWDNKGKNNG